MNIQKAREILSTKFGNLKFTEEGHKYTLNGKNVMCVSDFCKQWDTSDFNTIAKNYAKKNGYTAEYWLAKWAEKSGKSCDNGTFVHAYAEAIARQKMGEDVELPDISTVDSDTKAKCDAAMNYWISRPDREKPVAVETRVYTQDEKFSKNFAGTFDLLMYDEEKQGFIIRDYKTNADLLGNINYLRFMKQPFMDLTENGLGHYTLQQSCYQIPLVKAGIPIIGRELIWLKNDGTFTLIPLTDVTDRIEKILIG